MKPIGLKTSARLAALLALAGLALGGCQKNKTNELSQLREANVELRQQNAQLRTEADTAQDELMSLQDRLSELENELASEPAAPLASAGTARTGFEGIAGVEIEESPRGEVTVRVPGDVLFASGKVDLRNSAKQTLRQIADVLKRDYSAGDVRVEGYSDSDPIRKSKWKDNLELSTQRAMAVYRYLKSQGISEDRMYAAGFGATRFRASNSTAAGKAQNRRVEIVVVR